MYFAIQHTALYYNTMLYFYRNAVNDGRHRQNPFKDYSPAMDCDEIDTTKNDLTDAFKNTLIDVSKEFLTHLERNKREWYSREDSSVYTGTAGIAQMYYQFGRISNNSSYSKRALELIEISLSDKRADRHVSFLVGSVGSLAIGAIIQHESGNETESHKLIAKLCSFANNALADKSDELLYGKIGYLYALLFVNSRISSKPIDEHLIKQVIDRVIRDGKEYSKSHNHESPLMYEWYEKQYLGGAHGLAGILYILLQAREYLTETQLEQDVRPSIDYLETLKYPSGNFPSSLGSSSDKLVHWCHGAPSTSMFFLEAHKVFGKESYLQTAIECGEVVWSRGILKKGYGLCHGVAGNAYTFISLYQHTNDLKYLYRACKFAQLCREAKDYDRVPDRPFSLFEGLAGVIYFLVDLCQPKLAKFPAYTL
ncbi:glutathione S-transferase LANCL1 [Venturia canescens]|uniref:glutathione S-transferase LANCL1 n=1 Tax=Venturia canescens TaxID=32260 RepID=UPI001C9BEB3E|nr:glutathione S-transferase LANCL1 [Venturia canescens]